MMTFEEERLKQQEELKKLLLLDDYVVFGTGTFRNKRIRTDWDFSKRIEETKKFLFNFSSRSKTRFRKLRFVIKDEIHDVPNEEPNGHVHLAIAGFDLFNGEFEKSSTLDLVRELNKEWKENIGKPLFERFDSKRKSNACDYIAKAKVGNRFLLGHTVISPALRRHLKHIRSSV